MAYKKNVTFVISLLIPVTVVILIGLSPVFHEWLINAWSLQYIRNAFNPVGNESMLAVPPAGHARAVLWQASAALHSGNPALAETLIDLQAKQDDPLSMHLMADVRLAQGDFAGAVAMWQQTKDVASLQQAASQAEQAGSLEDALMAYNAAWTLDLESGTLPLANFLLDYSQDPSRAENLLRQSLATFPNSKYWFFWSNRLGDALRAQNRWKEAEIVYERIIAQAPNDWAAHIGLGWVRYECGDGLQAALSEFHEAINNPENQGTGQLAIAQVLTREKQFKEADAWFVQALALNPDIRWWYILRGDTALQAGNLMLALAVYQETIVRFPDYAFAYYQIAYVYQLNEQPAQAMASIEQALGLMVPPFAYYYIRAGSIYEWTGDKSRALNAYRQALQIDPQNEAALDGEERLNK